MARKNKARSKNGSPPATSLPPPRSFFRRNVPSWIMSAVQVLFFMTFVAQVFAIPSDSMEDTLLIGDRPFVERVAFAPRTAWLGRLLPYREIRRGDIIVFKHPAQADRIYLVKRVIGMPGDRLRIVNRQVIINGQFLAEGYQQYKSGVIENYRDNFPAAPPDAVYPAWREEMPKHLQDGWLVVPPGHYFAMGDNRDDSLDSRYWGFIPRENILGRPWALTWSHNFNHLFRIIHGSQE